MGTTTEGTSERSTEDPSEPARGPRQALTLGLLLGLWIGTPLVAAIVLRGYLPHGGLGYDAFAYWNAARAEQPYGAAPGEAGAYLYSPFFLQLITPLALLPWKGFLAVWLAVEVACLWWVTRPLHWTWQVPVLLLCLPEIVFGNIYGLLALMLVLGLRWPGLWAFAFLTKITIGVVGLVWFAVRREWGSVLAIVGWTAALTLVSALLRPDQWGEWLDFLFSNADSGSQVSRVVRLGLAVAVVAVGARRDARWVLPVGMFLAVPHFTFKNKDLSVLAALPRLSATRAPGAASAPEEGRASA